MKKAIYIFGVLALISLAGLAAQQSSIVSSISSDQLAVFNKETRKDSTGNNSGYNLKEYRQRALDASFEKAISYDLPDTKCADFNGDGETDQAVYIKNNKTSGLIIIHGKTNEEIKIGFGKPFSHMTEFDWVDYWGLVEDRETSEVTFTKDGEVSGSRAVKLENFSIELGADEVGGGLITFINGAYVWIHQTC